MGRKWGKKTPPTSTKAKDDASDKGDESVSDGASKDQVIILVSVETNQVFLHIATLFAESHAHLVGK